MRRGSAASVSASEPASRARSARASRISRTSGGSPAWTAPWRRPAPRRRREAPRQRRQHVVGVADQRRAVADQRVAAGRLGPVDVAGKCQDGNSALAGVAGGVEGAAAGRRLDDHDRVGERGDHRVAGQELPGLRMVVGLERRDDGAAAGGDAAASSRCRGGKKWS